jgi:hypothetical protein
VAKRQTFLTVYDYGTGGIWTFITADSAEQIRKELPALEIVYETPGWMTTEELGRLRTLDVDDRDDEFLTELRRLSS